jgi:glutathione S-transferase
MPSKPSKPLKLHGLRLSGHSHRAELLLTFLDLPYTFQPVDLPAGEHKQPAFLALNPFGQVPVLEDGDDVIADSVAILVYLASKYDPDRTWLPVDPLEAAKVQRWLSVAQGAIFNGPNKARLAKLFGRAVDHQLATAEANSLFLILDTHLTSHSFFAGETPTIADVALYSYIAVANEGELSLKPFAHLRAWLHRMENLPRFLPMTRSRPEETA